MSGKGCVGRKVTDEGGWAEKCHGRGGGADKVTDEVGGADKCHGRDFPWLPVVLGAVVSVVFVVLVVILVIFTVSKVRRAKLRRRRSFDDDQVSAPYSPTATKRNMLWQEGKPSMPPLDPGAIQRDRYERQRMGMVNRAMSKVAHIDNKRPTHDVCYFAHGAIDHAHPLTFVSVSLYGARVKRRHGRLSLLPQHIALRRRRAATRRHIGMRQLTTTIVNSSVL
ncbi:hypothetical protein NP493_1501g01000 [Ridgeia piscesae]|uniref:Uncharacterized protein n=1 Tax=Ridgeia piscesae TaxID=27915 RepID=A0AAD9K153_RIDPI|nr:hypothetical protein NP493_1501g01000 [Ridgeia piscesae]